MQDYNGLLHWPRLQQWIDAQSLPGTGPITSVEKLRGGLQNEVFLLARQGGEFVLRRPPRQPRSNSNETMLREVRVLTALQGSAVPHPEIFAACADESVIGACFYTMQALEGFSPSGELTGQYATNPEWRRALGEQLVDAAAALAAIDPAKVGLEDFGKPQDWHERQVSRWRSQLEGYRTLPNHEGSALPCVDQVGDWLAENLPRERRIGVIHGDLQVAIVLCSARQPRISGVVDWELATLGDPLLDLGWILASWWEEGDPDGKRPLLRPWDGLLSRADLMQRYAEASGRDPGSMPWFFVLACFKLACLLEGTYVRARNGQMPLHIGEQVHAYAVWLMAKAVQIIAGMR